MTARDGLVSDFLSCRPEDPEPCCSCTPRTQNRYGTPGSGEGQAGTGRGVVCWLGL